MNDTLPISFWIALWINLAFVFIYFYLWLYLDYLNMHDLGLFWRILKYELKKY